MTLMILLLIALIKLTLSLKLLTN